MRERSNERERERERCLVFEFMMEAFGPELKISHEQKFNQRRGDKMRRVFLVL